MVRGPFACNGTAALSAVGEWDARHYRHENASFSHRACRTDTHPQAQAQRRESKSRMEFLGNVIVEVHTLAKPAHIA